MLVAAFAGWNDAGDAATGAVEYLVQAWSAQQIADVDPEDFFDFTVTRPEVHLLDGVTRQIEWPSTTMAAAKLPGTGRDVILLKGTEPGLRWRTFCQALVDAGAALGVELMIGLGALLDDVPHTRPVRVTGGAADPELAERLGLSASRYEGPTGILGVLHDAFARSGVPSASLWATVPHYVGQSPSPKATLALVQRTAALVGTRMDTVDLQIASAAYERQVTEAVAADADAAAYVARLEEMRDADEADIPSADALAREVERFLREQPG